MIHERIRKARVDTGLSIKELSKKLNVVDRTISNYELGNRKPTIEYLIKLSNFCGLSIDYLATGKCRETDLEYAEIKRYELNTIITDGLDDSKVVETILIRRGWIFYVLETKPENLILFRIDGKNHEPILSHNDTCMVDISQTEVVTDGLYLISHDKVLRIKYLQLLISENRILIQPTNENSKEESVPLGSINIIGKVVWIGKIVK